MKVNGFKKHEEPEKNTKINSIAEFFKILLFMLFFPGIYFIGKLITSFF